MTGEVRIIDGEWVALTDWYEPHQKPHRVGIYESRVFDCGWQYEWLIFWDGLRWMDSENGWALTNQNVSWRGILEKVE